MAAVTVSRSFVAVDGPMKREVVNISSVSDQDTYNTVIQRPEFGYFVPTSDAGALTAAVNVAISGREVTFNSVDLVASAGVLVIYGF